MADGRIEFEITADGSRAYASIDEVTKKLEQNGKKWEASAKESTDQIGTSFSGMLKKIGGAISAAAIGKALLDIGKQAIQAASDLEEVQNVVDVTFGPQGAATIENWAKNAGKQFGLSETQAKKFTSTLGAMMKSAGMTGDEVVTMSTDMAGLAADMASFYNMDFDTAFQKIRSGISGETEPLKQLGINMSVANLEAFALQQGLSKTFSEMTQGEQVMLRYQYLMQATSDAQGDFARTSEGYANATRRVETAMETIKTKGGELLMQVIEPLTSGLASFLEKLGSDPGRTVLDEFNDIDAETIKKMDKIEKSAEQARQLVETLGQIEQKSSTAKENLASAEIKIPAETVKNAKSMAGSLLQISKFAEKINEDGSTSIIETPLYKSVEGMGNNAAKADEGLKGLQQTVSEISEEGSSSGLESFAQSIEDTAAATGTANTASSEWLEICNRLVQTIPGLATIINRQTGEIQGGTDAINEYIDAWERAQKNLVLIEANRQKNTVLAQKESEVDLLFIDKIVAQRREREARQAVEDVFRQFDVDVERIQKVYGLRNAEDVYRLNFVSGSAAAEQAGITSEMADGVNKVTGAYREAYNAAYDATNAYQVQKDALDEATVALAEENQILIDNMTAEEKAALIVDQYTQAQQAAAAAVEDARESMETYRKNAIEKTIESVNKLISGFKSIKLPSKSDLPKPGEMAAALQSQLAFMQKYQENLAKAKENGLDENLLSELANGTEESAKYLQALADNPEQIAQINEAYKAVNEEKQKFAESLTDANLAVDSAYKDLQSKLESARDQQKAVEDAIAQNAGDSIAAMAANINANAGALEAAIDNVNAILARLGLTPFTLGALGLDGSHATGLDYVPFNGYLAELHEGEGILTAEENKVWQNFKAGQHSLDYDQLGGVMRDNVKAGGNVYLDGRIVGNVISDYQGRTYRQLQRSGWQG